MAAWLNRHAEARNLSLEARVADPNGRFEKIHAKGVIVDRETVIVGSLNWNHYWNLLIRLTALRFTGTHSHISVFQGLISVAGLVETLSC